MKQRKYRKMEKGLGTHCAVFYPARLVQCLPLVIVRNKLNDFFLLNGLYYKPFWLNMRLLTNLLNPFSASWYDRHLFHSTRRTSPVLPSSSFSLHLLKRRCHVFTIDKVPMVHKHSAHLEIMLFQLRRTLTININY